MKPRTRSHLLSRLQALALMALVAAGCEISPWNQDAFAGSGSAVPGEELRRAPVHVDSIFPMDEELRRFRVGLDAPDSLSNGEGSMERLVEALIHRLEQADTAAVAAMPLTRAEFAWFYFPNTMYMEKPYELPPGFVWYHQQNRTSQGLRWLLRAHAGEELFYTGLRCPDEGEPFGPGRIWHGCTVLGELPDGEAVEERIFGSILERDGIYKLVSFSSDL